MSLRRVARDSPGPIGQDALDQLADSEFEAGLLEQARQDYASLEALYPETEGAWIAAMRYAQLTFELRGPDEGAAAFVRIRRVYGDTPTVSALASYYEGTAHEASERWSDAIRAFGQSLAAWPESEAALSGLDWKNIYWVYPSAAAEWTGGGPSRDGLTRRVATLLKVINDPSVADFEHATWLIARGRYGEGQMRLRRSGDTVTV